MEINFLGEVQAISLSGETVSRNVLGSPCEMRTRLRDLHASGVLQQEGILPAKQPELVSRDVRGMEIARFPLAPADVTELRLSPRGHAVLTVGDPAPVSSRCVSGLYLARNRAQLWDLLWCPDVEGLAPDSASWSPDERRIAFAHQNQVFVMALDERRPRLVGRGRFVRWSPVADRIAFVDGDHVVIQGLRPNDPQKHLVVPGLIANSVEWSPNGQYFVAAWRAKIQPGDGRVLHELGIVDASTWQVRPLGVQRWGDRSDLRWVPLTLSRIDDLVTTRKAACE
ncbi:TolB family protein [Paludibaculum fermentans]|uniref:TolB family protein n=1 Tax=Paludibaculum fermentans TaxID=1473598 RepID=UPI003EB9C437